MFKEEFWNQISNVYLLDTERPVNWAHSKKNEGTLRILFYIDTDTTWSEKWIYHPSMEGKLRLLLNTDKFNDFDLPKRINCTRHSLMNQGDKGFRPICQENKAE